MEPEGRSLNPHNQDVIAIGSSFCEYMLKRERSRMCGNTACYNT